MQLKPLAFAPFLALSVSAFATDLPQIQFTTQVSRTVDKDLMIATLFSQKEGKSLPELKKAVSANLNQVIAQAKQYPSIEISAQGVNSQANYDNGKMVGWQAYGDVVLKSKDFEAMAKVLDSLEDKVAVQSIDFSVSSETQAKLEDEMTAEAIKQFQHKAEVVRASLNAKGYRLKEVNLDTPTAAQEGLAAPMMKASFKAANTNQPLEAGKATIAASASGSVIIEE